MISVKILGTGCTKCNTLEAKVREIVSQNEIDVTIEKITDINEMINYKIMMTPGLVVNEVVKSVGKIPNDDQIIKWIYGELPNEN